MKDFYAGLVLASLLAVASCDRGAETAEAPAQAGSVATSLPEAQSPDAVEYAQSEEAGEERGSSARSSDPREQPIPRHKDGKPLWSANSRNTAEQNAERLFERNGQDFGARNVDQYVDMAHAFIAEPPKGTLQLTRDNGDRLFYDPKGNVFLVATAEGAPRTMFKPEDGMTYWREQEQRIARGGERGAGRNTEARGGDQG